MSVREASAIPNTHTRTACSEQDVTVRSEVVLASSSIAEGYISELVASTVYSGPEPIAWNANPRPSSSRSVS
jgi:hypothetical protein